MLIIRFMASWSQRRQIYISAGIILLIVLSVVFIYFSGRESANCFDGKLNQNEEGIDCGGSCKAICQFKAEDVAILWSRVIPVVDDVYSVVAMIENPNLNFEAKNVPYTFKLYDDENILIFERKGSAYFLSGATFPVFEHALRTGQRIPARAVFSLRDDPFWEQTSSDDVEIRVITKNLSNEDESPRLTVVVKNPTFQILNDVEFIALLYDKDENLVNASKTVLERLDSEQSDTIIFTWPEPFTTTIARMEIVPVAYVR